MRVLMVEPGMAPYEKEINAHDQRPQEDTEHAQGLRGQSPDRGQEPGRRHNE